MKSKALMNVNSVIGSLTIDTIIEQNNSNDEMCDGTIGEKILKIIYGTEMK